MESPFLSIIVPVYNVKEYLPECLDSLLAQAQDKPVELLLIDDGSTDGSGEVCREYADKHDCIRLTRQENGGASSARNAGMKLARGEYMQFVDSDDWLEPGALDRIFAMLNRQPDVLLVNLNRYRDGEMIGSTGWKSSSLQAGQRAFLEKLIQKEEVYNVVVSPIIRRQWQQQEELYFLEGVIHEDMEWVPHLLCRAESTMILDEPVYAYRMDRAGSVMTATGLEKHLDSLLLVARTLMGESSEYETDVRRFAHRAAGLCLFMAMDYALDMGRDQAKATEKHLDSLLLVARTLMGESSEYETDVRRFAHRAAGLCLFMAMDYALDMGRDQAKATEKELKGDLLLAPALKQLPKKYRLACLLGGGLAGGMEKYRRWQK